MRRTTEAHDAFLANAGERSTSAPGPLVTTTPSSAIVAIQDLAEHLILLTLRVRDVVLGHKAPKSSYVYQLRRDCRPKRGRAKPWHQLLAISFADVDDPAVPLDEVTEPYRQAITLIEARRREVTTYGSDLQSLLPLMIRETRDESAVNVAQLRVQEYPDDPEAHDALIEAVARYSESAERMVAASRERSAILRNRSSRISAPFERTIRRGRVVSEARA
jgi:hypothetical protein